MNGNGWTDLLPDTLELSPDDLLPESLTPTEAYLAAFHMVRQYIALEEKPDDGLVLLLQYLISDPARSEDWVDAVRQALDDKKTIDPGR
jgi:hypothetical protein